MRRRETKPLTLLGVADPTPVRGAFPDLRMEHLGHRNHNPGKTCGTFLVDSPTQSFTGSRLPLIRAEYPLRSNRRSNSIGGAVDWSLAKANLQK